MVDSKSSTTNDDQTPSSLMSSSSKSARRGVMLKRYRELVKQRNVQPTGEAKLSEKKEKLPSSVRHASTTETSNMSHTAEHKKEAEETSFIMPPEKSIVASSSITQSNIMKSTNDEISDADTLQREDNDETIETLSDDESSLWAMIGGIKRNGGLRFDNKEGSNNSGDDAVDERAENESGALNGDSILNLDDDPASEKQSDYMGAMSFLGSFVGSEVSGEVKLGIELGLENMFDAELTRIECVGYDSKDESVEEKKEEGLSGIHEEPEDLEESENAKNDKQTSFAKSTKAPRTPSAKPLKSSIQKQRGKPKSVAFSPFSHIISDEESCNGGIDEELESLDGKDISFSHDNDCMSPMTPHSTFRRDSVDSALEESFMYMEKIDKLATNLKSVNADEEINNEAQSNHERRIEELVIHSQRALSEIMNIKKSFLSDNADNSIMVSPINGKKDKITSVTASLIERNKTLVKEIRFADQTCVELSERNNSLENQIKRLEKELRSTKKENTSMHDTILTSAKHGAKLEAKVDILIEKDTKQKSEFDAQLLSVSSALENSKKQAASMNMEIEEYKRVKLDLESRVADLHNQQESLTKEKLESSKIIKWIMEHVTGLDNITQPEENYQTVFEQLQELKDVFVKQFKDIRNQDEMSMSNCDELKQRCIELKDRLVTSSDRNPTVEKFNTCDKEVNTLTNVKTIFAQPFTSHPPTSQVLAKTLQYELKRGHSLSERAVEAEKSLAVTKAKIDSINGELCLSNQEKKKLHKSLDKVTQQLKKSVQEKEEIATAARFWEDKSRQLELDITKLKDMSEKTTEAASLKSKFEDSTDDVSKYKKDLFSMKEKLKFVSSQLQESYLAGEKFAKEIASLKLSEKQLKLCIEKTRSDYQKQTVELEKANEKIQQMVMAANNYDETVQVIVNEKDTLAAKIVSCQETEKELQVCIKETQNNFNKQKRLYESTTTELEVVKTKLQQLTIETNIKNEIIESTKMNVLTMFQEVEQNHEHMNTLIEKKVSEASERVNKLTDLVYSLSDRIQPDNECTLLNYINNTHAANDSTSVTSKGIKSLFNDLKCTSITNGNKEHDQSNSALDILNATFGIEGDSRDSLSLLDLMSPTSKLDHSRSVTNLQSSGVISEESPLSPSADSKVSKLKSKLRSSMNSYQKLKTENLALLEMLEVANSEVDEIKNSMCRLKQECANENKQLVESISLQETVKSEYSNSEGSPSANKNEKETLEIEVMQLNARLRNLQSEIQRLREEMIIMSKAHENEKNALDSEMIKLKSEGESCISELENEIAHNEELKKELVSAKTMLKSKEEELCSANCLIRSLEKELMLGKERLSELSSLQKNSNDEYRKLEKKFTETTAKDKLQISNIKASFWESQNQYNEKAELLSSSTKLTDDLKSQIVSLKDYCKRLEKANSNLQAHDSHQQCNECANSSRLKDKLDAANNRIMVLEEEHELASKEKRELLNSLKNKEDECSGLQKVSEEAERRILYDVKFSGTWSYADKNGSASSPVISLQNDLSLAEKRQRELADSLRKSQDECIKIKKKLSQTSTQRDSEITQLESLLFESQCQFNDNAKSLSASLVEVANLKSKITVLEGRCKELEDANSNLTTDKSSTLCRECKFLRKSLGTETQRNSILQEELHSLMRKLSKVEDKRKQKYIQRRSTLSKKSTSYNSSSFAEASNDRSSSPTFKCPSSKQLIHRNISRDEKENQQNI